MAYQRNDFIEIWRNTMCRFTRLPLLLLLLMLLLRLEAQEAQPQPPMSKQSKNFVMNLVGELAKIKTIPRGKNEISEDPRYNFIYANRLVLKERVADCIQSDKRMANPYSEPSVSTFTVGDLAFFMLCDWGEIDFDKVVIKFVSPEELKARGVYAYYDWVKKPGNRGLLHHEVMTLLGKQSSRPE